MINWFSEWLFQQGLSSTMAEMSARLSFTILLFGAAYLCNQVTKKLLLKVLARIISRTKTRIDDTLLESRVFAHLAHFAPAIVLSRFLPMVLEGYPQVAATSKATLAIYMILLSVLTLDALLNALSQLYDAYFSSKKIPIKVFVQVLKVILYFVAFVLIVSVLLDKSPVYLLSGLGAVMAILLLIFKDVILGLVAGIQLTANRMVSVGDWIEMPKYGADGDVIDVSLTTVKIQNWDMTITTIPTYALISESFKNWRGMSESEGRRIKRAIHIDLNTLKFCTDSMLDRFETVALITDYIREKRSGLSSKKNGEPDFTQEASFDAIKINQRRLTNIGTFRAYALAYLKAHPMIHQDMTFIVRQLDATQHGLPLEIYVFCKDKNWANYEAIQADIFDHLFAALPVFELRIFQDPAGSDFAQVLRQASHKKSNN